MNRDLRLSKVLPIVILAIILILVSLHVPQLSLLLLLVPVPFALIGTLTNIKNNIIILILTCVVSIFFVKPIYIADVFINSIIPGMLIGMVAKKVLKNQDSNKYEPIFAGSLIFILSIAIHYFISKYTFNIDLLEEILGIFNTSLETQKSFIEAATDIEIFNTQNIMDTFRNLIPSMLFFRGMILSIVIYLVEVFALRKMKYGNLSDIKFRYFYLPGNAIMISFILYLLMILLSSMKTPLYTEAIFLNLQVVFNFMFIIQGLSVCTYFVKKWLSQGTGKKVLIGVLCVGIFGVTGISFIGMIDSILDFRNVRVCKSI